MAKPTKKPTKPSRKRKPKPGPKLKAHEKGVHIIHVALPPVLAGLKLRALPRGKIGKATLLQVEKHIGHPKPTDVVVFAGEPWHFAGKTKGTKHLRSHPQVHMQFPETVLKLSRKKQQTVVWWSETPFTAITINPSGTPSHPNPAYPEALTAPPPTPFAIALAIRIEQWQGQDMHVVRSTVPIAAADRHMYKIQFSMAGDPIDPDTYCSP